MSDMLETLNKKNNEIRELKNWLKAITELGFGHDGRFTRNSMYGLVDKIVEYANDALAGKMCMINPYKAERNDFEDTVQVIKKNKR